MPRRRRSKKWMYTVVVLILLVVAGVVVYLVWDSYFRDKNEVMEDHGSATQTAEVNDVKTKNDDSSDAMQTKETTSVEEALNKAIQYEGESPNTLEYLTGTINYIGVNSGKLMIRVSIYQFLEEGKCELVITKDGGAIYQDVVNIVNDATTSTCKGFDVPVAELTSGKLGIMVYLSSGERTGELSGEVEI